MLYEKRLISWLIKCYSLDNIPCNYVIDVKFIVKYIVKLRSLKNVILFLLQNIN